MGLLSDLMLSPVATGLLPAAGRLPRRIALLCCRASMLVLLWLLLYVIPCLFSPIHRRAIYKEIEDTELRGSTNQALPISDPWHNMQTL